MAGVEWCSYAWFVGCDGDLSATHEVLSRCYNAGDRVTIQDAACVRRIHQALLLIDRVRGLILSFEVGNYEAIVDDAIHLLRGDDSDDRHKQSSSVIEKTALCDLLEATTELLINDKTQPSSTVLDKWVGLLRGQPEGELQFRPPCKLVSRAVVTKALQEIEIVPVGSSVHSSGAASVLALEILQLWDAEIRQVYQQLIIDDEDERQRMTLAKHVENAFRRSSPWEEAQVIPFGSSVSKFGSKHSDVDLCFRTSESTGDKRYPHRSHIHRSHHASVTQNTLDQSKKTLATISVGLQKLNKKRANPVDSHRVLLLQDFQEHFQVILEALEAENESFGTAVDGNECTNQLEIAQSTLAGEGFSVLHVVTGARIPMIRFAHPSSPYECDLCFDNELMVHSTTLLRSYAENDERVRILGVLIKQWAKQRGISDASRGFLKPFGYVLLVIYYLQSRLGLVPNLQHPTQRNHVNCDQNVVEMLLGFFAFYTTEFQFDKYVVSIRFPSRRISKKLRWGDANAKHWRMSLEDPVETDNDLGRAVNQAAQEKIHDELRRGYELLRAGARLGTVLSK
ncbi:hypothetical protein Poli38472_014321 [Pythium oligandrum]|uniref:Polynucleotide adenylyltransferase n=1 Tax=Pythium oligandrum TaxID=41045 RepID=A0A8K1FGE9_PYTOL|nr:hypothetical protein Poli38472_014321 [Pythium oligandrum]|eukprot:TMW57718.1 hypothetical protein Poli38472_014321 [Pythium oligandrum]